MVGFWIEWEKGLVRKPEVMRIARLLSCTPQHAAACCMQVWEWAEDATSTGFVPDIDAEAVSFAAGVAGIGEAMRDVGWLTEDDNGVNFPNWDRHNGQPAKERALNALRMRITRAEAKAAELEKRAKNVRK